MAMTPKIPVSHLRRLHFFILTVAIFRVGLMRERRGLVLLLAALPILVFLSYVVIVGVLMVGDIALTLLSTILLKRYAHLYSQC